MKVGSRYRWDFVGCRFRGKSATRLCTISDAKSEESRPGHAPIYINVYDLTTLNDCVYWAGFGIFHTGVQVHGVEYAFGAHEHSTSGVFQVEPRQCPDFKFRKSIYMGRTWLDPLQTREFMERQSTNYSGDSYHLVVNNCNHFCDDICSKLTCTNIPKWVNRLARIGSVCKCILPNNLKATKELHGSLDIQMCDEKRKLRNSLSCITNIAEEVSISSISLNSYYKGCLSWKQTRSLPELEE